MMTSTQEVRTPSSTSKSLASSSALLVSAMPCAQHWHCLWRRQACAASVGVLKALQPLVETQVERLKSRIHKQSDTAGEHADKSSKCIKVEFPDSRSIILT